MKKNRAAWKNPLLMAVVSWGIFGWAPASMLAEEAIHWDDNATSQMTPTPALVPPAAPTVSPASVASPVPAANPAAKPMSSTGGDLQETEAAALTPTPAASPVASEAATPDLAPTTAAPTAEPTPLSAQGVLKMKDVYAVGMKYYGKEDYVEAIKYLKQALTVHDPYTPSFYYAEANAMLGVIYQFHIIHPDLAYQYYHEALKIDPTTEAAKKHIGEVAPGQN